MVNAKTFDQPMTALEVYRVNRIRLAKTFGLDPHIIDEWDLQTYYDAIEVEAADDILFKLDTY